MYAQQYRDHLLTLCPGGKGLAGFIGEGMGGMTAAMMQPKGTLESQTFLITYCF